MGGQEALLLLAEHPHLLAGVVAFDAPTDLTARYYAIARLRHGAFLQRLMRTEVGGTPDTAPALYAARSPLHFSARIARAGVPVELWWSRRDKVVVDQSSQSGRLFRRIRQLNPHGRFRQIVGDWSHMAEMSWREHALRAALRWLGLSPATPAPLDGQVCARPPPGDWGYGWPVKPFDQPHPVRGNFGDPRTIFFSDLGQTGLLRAGSFSFHDGVDIDSRPGARVYPVVSGRITVVNADTIEVRTADDRRFRYVYLRIAVHTGARATADQTVLGYIKKRWRHVHLTEIDPITVHGLPDSGYQVVNPLSHLSPYNERTAPRVAAVLARDIQGHRMLLTDLHGEVRLVANAFGFPAMAVRGVWHHMPISPALLRWQLVAASGEIMIGWHTAIDFRRTIPSDRLFWRSYARGTYQNFPQIGHVYYYARRGRYLYELTPADLNTSTLADGRYTLLIQAGGICGHARTRKFPITIANVPR
jgi:hypothetical protein